MVDRAGQGEGQLALFAGEPGIGKSTVMEWLASEAAGQGATVAWGRCWEAGGAPPYWPWHQVFRALGLDDGVFRRGEGRLMGVAEAEFEAFDRAVSALGAIADGTFLTLVLDDLHAADTPSLGLLLLLSQQLRARRLLVLGAYRDAELRRRPAVAAPLAKIGRSAAVFPLARLTAEDISAWVHEAMPEAPGTTSDELFQLTEGHPLFMVEALRLGVRTVGQAIGLGTLLEEHLGRVSPSTRQVLETAAVVGREFAAGTVSVVGGHPRDEVHAALLEAIAIALVQRTPELERFRFAHVLLRDRLYAELRPSRRAELHRGAGEELLARSPSERVTAVYHLFEGHDGQRSQPLAALALEAADDALGNLAFEEAAAVARRALALPDAPQWSGAVRGLLQVALAEALIRVGQSVEGKALCLRAAEACRGVDDLEVLPRAALVYGTELSSGIVDPQMIALLRRALAVVGTDDSAVRARLLTRLAAALTPPPDNETAEEALVLMRTATEMARRLEEPATLLYVLQFAATVGLVVPDEERFALMEETIQRATGLDQRLVLLQSYPAYLTLLLARGQRTEAGARLPIYDQLVVGSRQPLHRVQRALVHALVHLLDGDFERADRWSAEARTLAEQAPSEAGLRLWSNQRLSFALLCRDPGRLAVDAHHALDHFSAVVRGVAYFAWILATLGRATEARDRLAALDLKSVVPSGQVMNLHGAAETCLQLGDVALAEELYPRLVQALDRMFWSVSAGALVGPMERTLGELAALTGRWDQAARHFEVCLSFSERLGSPLLIDQCRLLLDEARRRLLGRAQTDATVAATGVQTEVGARAQTEVETTTTTGASGGRTVVLERQGDTWELRRPSDPALRLKHSKGLAYLSYLLERPDQDVHVFELTGTEHREGSTGPLLDARAKDQYRRRLEDLREQHAEAERFADGVRASRLGAEIDALTAQLSRALGLGGRDRVSGSAVERARINVQRCLKEAIDRIASHDPALGRYLSASVKSGTFCAYRPV